METKNILSTNYSAYSPVPDGATEFKYSSICSSWLSDKSRITGTAFVDWTQTTSAKASSIRYVQRMLGNVRACASVCACTPCVCVCDVESTVFLTRRVFAVRLARRCVCRLLVGRKMNGRFSCGRSRKLLRPSDASRRYSHDTPTLRQWAWRHGAPPLAGKASDADQSQGAGAVSSCGHVTHVASNTAGRDRSSRR